MNSFKVAWLLSPLLLLSLSGCVGAPYIHETSSLGSGLRRPVVTELVANSCFDSSLRFAVGGYDKYLLSKGVSLKDPPLLSEKISP